MSKSLARVRAVLQAHGLTVEPVECAGETRTAAQAAAQAGCAPDQIVKSILMRGADGGLRLFLTAGGNRVDPVAAEAAAGLPLARAEAEEVRRVTGFAIGGVAPFGHLTALPAFLDPRLTEFATVWAAAGTPRHIVALSPADLIRLSGARLAPFARPGGA
jgi:prolyl-tRNA editing enzyme YbaK/EbsC (Cys-tRNA(Pro) deacylase)